MASPRWTSFDRRAGKMTADGIIIFTHRLWLVRRCTAQEVSA